MNTPNTLIYTPEHLWIKSLGESTYEIGITNYAQDLLGDIVFIELPAIQTQILRDVAFGVVESVKTASDLIGPLNGVITEINPIISKSPEVINDQPYKNWICKIHSLDDTSNKEFFLDAARYNELIR
jgi:glycine cleavage system H protein